MFRRAVFASAVAALTAGALAGAGAASAGAQVLKARTAGGGLGALIPAHAGQPLPTQGGTVESLNWSGYAVTPSSPVTSVSSTFTVPTAGLVPPGFAATWTGIGGYGSSDLIQAGVAENSLPGNAVFGPQYYPWVEMLPASESPISGCTGDANCTVRPGDQVSVTITNTTGSTWSISLSDAGHWSWSQSFQYASSRNSAEWILEAPSIVAQTTLANTGTTHFGPTSTYTAGGATNTIAQGNPTEIILTPSPVGGVAEATPSALASDGQSFNDCAYQTSCPAP